MQLCHISPAPNAFESVGPFVCWRKILEELDPVATETQAAAVHRLGRCAAAAGFFFLSNA